MRRRGGVGEEEGERRRVRGRGGERDLGSSSRWHPPACRVHLAMLQIGLHEPGGEEEDISHLIIWSKMAHSSRLYSLHWLLWSEEWGGMKDEEG